MTERWGMLQLNPHLLVWNTYFTDLIRILRTAKGRVENESKGGGGGRVVVVVVRKQKIQRCVGV